LLGDENREKKRERERESGPNYQIGGRNGAPIPRGFKGKFESPPKIGAHLRGPLELSF
jgi:hypothetical protein